MSLLPFGLQEIVQVDILESLDVDSVTELSLNIFYEVADKLELIGTRLGLSSCDDIHVNLSCGGISCRLLKSALNQLHCLFDIFFLDELGESHLGKRLSDTDHRLKLSGGSSYCLGGVTEASHLDVFLD